MPSMASLKAPQLVDLLVALADLGYHPGPAWLRQHELCCNQVVSQLTAYQVGLRDAARWPVYLSGPRKLLSMFASCKYRII